MPKSFIAISCLFFSLACSFSSVFADETASPPVTKEWTLLVYLNGNNNLDSFGKLNINQMEEVGSTDDINIVVQWASLRNKKTQRLYVVKDSNLKQVTSPIIQDMGSVDMGDWNSLVNFVRWGAAKYPARHYFVDVWNHGSGWRGQRSLDNMFRVNYSPFDISWDDISGHHITTAQLGQALAQSAKIIGHKVDLYASDACLMAMAEVADQVADSVNIFAGSEEVEPGAGWPYHTFLQRWAMKPKSSAEEISQILTEEYVKFYSSGNNGSSGTFSAFDLNKMPLLNASVLKFGQSLLGLDANSRKKVVSIVNETQSFTYSDYKDLSDFLSRIDAAKLDGLEKDATADLERSIHEFVIAHGATSDYENALGLSIWLPGSAGTYKAHASAYEKLLFQSHTQWGDVLKFLLQ